MRIINEITGANNISESSDSAEAVVQKLRLPTGVDILDRNLSGGLPYGSLVYFSASPKSMPEVFMYELCTPRKTYYITTYKSTRYLIRNMKELDFDPDKVEFIDIHDEYYHNILSTPADRRARSVMLYKYIDDWLDKIQQSEEKNITIIFDTFSFLIELGIDIDSMKHLLDKLYDIINDGGGICYIMMIKGMHDESVESHLQYWCDVIFDIELERKGDKIINKLTLPKIRGMSPVTDYIKFKVTDRITIDTSRDIV